MSDQTNPPVNPHQPGATGGHPGPNGPYPTPGTQSDQFGAQGNQGLWPQGGGQPPQQSGQPPYQGQPQPGYQGQPQYGQPPLEQYGQPPVPQYGQPPLEQYGQPQQAPYGQPQYGGPQGDGGQPPYGPGYGQAQQWQPEPPKRRNKWIPLVAVVAVLAVLGGGGLFAYARLNGGGGQPAEVLPATAVAYARIDLNPSAGQRVAALRYLMKFPSAKERIGLTSDNDDLRQKLFDLLKKEAGDDLADVDFEKDVKPWLGDRAGLAALPPSGDRKTPDVVVAVQVKSEDKANDGLDKLFAKVKEKPGRVFTDGYVLLGDNQALVDSAASTAKDSPLSKDSRFDGDMSALGEQGFASFWADTAGLALIGDRKLTEDQRKALPAGSMAAALRFDASYVELKGVVRSDQTVKTGAADAGDVLAKLPESSAGGIAVSGGSDLVDTAWAQMKKSSGLDLEELTSGFTDQYGIVLPADLKTLLGKNFAVAIDRNADDGPKIGLRSETDPAKAGEVVDKAMRLLRERSRLNIPIEKAQDGGTLVVATDKAYAEQVLKGGSLGESESFKQAIPDTKGAMLAAYVDFDGIGALTEELKANKDAAALRSAGVTIRHTEGGQADFTLRVVAK